MDKTKRPVAVNNPHRKQGAVLLMFRAKNLNSAAPNPPDAPPVVSFTGASSDEKRAERNNFSPRSVHHPGDEAAPTNSAPPNTRSVLMRRRQNDAPQTKGRMQVRSMDRTTFVLLWVAFFLLMLALILPDRAKGQTLPLPGDPVVVTLTAKDEAGNVLYHRTGYLFWSAPLEFGAPDYMIAKDEIMIQRVLREPGARCDDVLPTDIHETCSVSLDYCRPTPAPARRRP